jgi:hypothetical protein
MKRDPQPHILRQRVCRLLGIREEQYLDYQFEMGMRWLAHQLPHDRSGQRLLATREALCYWPWWRRQWHIREDVWLMAMCPDALSLMWRKDSPADNDGLTPSPSPKERGASGVPLGQRMHLVVEDDLDTELRLRWERIHTPEKVIATLPPTSPLHPQALSKTLSNHI